MLHACAARFDVTGNLEKFCKLNKAWVWCDPPAEPRQGVVDLDGVGFTPIYHVDISGAAGTVHIHSFIHSVIRAFLMVNWLTLSLH